MHTLTNGTLTIGTSELGGELRSLMCEGREYLWQGDPAWWHGQSPILFPIVGGLRNGSYTLGGQTYSMPQHGVARKRDFELLHQTPDSITWRLRDNRETRLEYPYAFSLEQGYRLSGRSVVVSWRVDNFNDETMYFSIGAHPGFHAPMGATIRLSRSCPTCRRLQNNLAGAPEPFQTDQLTLSPTLYDRGVYILDGLDWACLESDHQPYLRLDFPGFPHLGLWAPAGGAPFTCIEPWFGHADPVEPYGDFTRKPGIHTLAPHATFQASYRITVL